MGFHHVAAKFACVTKLVGAPCTTVPCIMHYFKVLSVTIEHPKIPKLKGGLGKSPPYMHVVEHIEMQ